MTNEQLFGWHRHGAAIRAAVEAGDLRRALGWFSSEERLTGLRELFRFLPKDERRADFFAEIYSASDWPAQERAFVLRALRQFQRRGWQGFCGDTAKARWLALPAVVRVWRGGVLAEWPRRLGTSWTLSEKVAHWFAFDHGRFRNLESPAVVFSATVPKLRIDVMIDGRDETELVLHPRDLSDVRKVTP